MSSEYASMPAGNVSFVRRVFAGLNYRHDTTCIDDPECSCMLEIVGATILADEDHIFGEPNRSYIDREISWYESQSLNVHDIPGATPRIWEKIAVPGVDGETYPDSLKPGTINSNYGYLLYSSENGSQYNNVVAKLEEDINTRQAVAVYTRGSIHDDWDRDGMHDFICTNTVQYIYRDNALHAIVNMRSNDAIFGYRNDYAWQHYVLVKICNELHLTPGDILWQVGSLHIYPRHRNLVRHFAATGEHNGEV